MIFKSHYIRKKIVTILKTFYTYRCNLEIYLDFKDLRVCQEIVEKTCCYTVLQVISYIISLNQIRLKYIL